MKRVTGVGGVFFKAKDPKRLADWYRDHLGLQIEEWGGVVFPCPPAWMEAYAVSSRVGNVQNDDPELIAPLAM